MSRPQVVVLGTGALASYLGARLARSGAADVTLAGSWREGLAAIQAGGVTVEERGEQWVQPLTAVAADALPEGRADFTLVLVKAYQTSARAPLAARATGAQGLIVTLQNGWGNREILAAHAGSDRVAAGVIMAGVTLLGPGRVRAFPRRIVLAESRRSDELAKIFGKAGLWTETAPDIDRELWRKMAVNCAINPLTALLRVPNGALLQDPRTEGYLLAAAREVGAVAAARGLDLGIDPGRLALEIAQDTAENRSSMLQDLERGTPTEIDALCGTVVKEGRRLAVPTPVNDDLLLRVREASSAVAAG